MTEKELLEIFQGYRTPEKEVEIEDIFFRYAYSKECPRDLEDINVLAYMGFDRNRPDLKNLDVMIESLFKNVAEIEDNGLKFGYTEKGEFYRIIDPFELLKTVIKVGNPFQLSWFMYCAIVNFISTDKDLLFKNIIKYSHPEIIKEVERIHGKE